MLTMVISQKLRLAKLLCALLALTHCTTFKSDEELRKEQDIREAKYGIIVNFLDQGKPEMALAEARKLQKESPDDDRTLNLLGLSFLALGQPKPAAMIFRKALKIRYDITYQLNLSSAQIEMKAYRAALANLQKLPSSDILDYRYPERISHNRAVAYERLGQQIAALNHYKAALKFNPAYYPTLMATARLHETRKELDAAKIFFRRAKDACLQCFEPVRVLVEDAKRRSQPAVARQLLSEYLKTEELPDADRAAAKQMQAKL